MLGMKHLSVMLIDDMYISFSFIHEINFNLLSIKVTKNLWL